MLCHPANTHGLGKGNAVSKFGKEEDYLLNSGLNFSLSHPPRKIRKKPNAKIENAYKSSPGAPAKRKSKVPVKSAAIIPHTVKSGRNASEAYHPII